MKRLTSGTAIAVGSLAVALPVSEGEGATRRWQKGATLPWMMSSPKPYGPAIAKGVYYGEGILGPLCFL